jgi:WD40 repeat protein
MRAIFLRLILAACTASACATAPVVAQEPDTLVPTVQSMRSLLMATFARERLREGQPITAMQLSLVGLAELDGRPETAVAAGALAEALGQQRERVVVQEFAELLPDGRRLLSFKDSVGRLRDAATGQVLVTFAEPTGAVKGIEFSVDGRRALTRSEDKTARLWDLDTGVALLTLRVDDKMFNRAYLSRDDRRIVSWTSDGTSRLWDAGTGQLIAILDSANVRHVSFSGDGRLVATMSADGVVRLWDAATGKPQRQIRTHEGRTAFVLFSPVGTTLATASADAVRLWDAVSGQQIVELPSHGNGFDKLKFSPDAKMLLSVSSTGTVLLSDTASGARIAELPGHSDAKVVGVFSADANRVAIWPKDSTVRVWETATGKPLAVLPHPDGILGFALSPDGRRAISAWGNRLFGPGTAKLWMPRQAGSSQRYADRCSWSCTSSSQPTDVRR